MTNARKPPVENIDITPPYCSVFSSMEEVSACPSVVMLNAEASPAQLLGFAYSRVKELLTLASLASASDEDEQQMRAVTTQLWEGLETVHATLDAMAKQMGRA